MINIRPCLISDVPALLPLMESLEYPCSEIELTDRFQKFIACDGYGVIVADINGNIAGFIAWSKSILFVSDTARFHIEALIVDEKYRGLKIGQKLMQYIEERAVRPAVIDLVSGIRRAKNGTHEFYKKLGYGNEGNMAKLYLRKEIK